MKTQTKLLVPLTLAAALLGLSSLRLGAIDLLAQYPTQLTAGDAKPENARPWEFKNEDIFRLSQFVFDLGAGLNVQVGTADVGIGHCKDGAVWAVVLPVDTANLTSSAASQQEAIAHVWLRFHPSQINAIFPPETVFAGGNTALAGQMRAIVDAKFRNSWHAGMNAMIPEPKEVTVDIDTKGGPRRFFSANTETRTAEYVAAFARQSLRAQAAEDSSTEISLSSAPPVVVKTVPEAGAVNVDPGLTEITVTFSKPMTDKSWSWSTWGQDTFPDIVGDIHYLADGRTCVLPVKLKPGKFYASWLNSNKFKNFKDSSGQPSVPYLLTFQTQP